MSAGQRVSRMAMDLRIALVSTGLSHVHRGYESFIQDLYEALKGTCDVTLFKGSGWSAPPDIYTIPCLRRDNSWVRRLSPNDESVRYRYEQLSLAMNGYLQGHWKQYSIVHFCDPAFGGALLWLKRLFRHEYQLLFGNCGPSDPQDYRRFDHIQEFTPMYLDEAKKVIRKTHLHLNPMGIWAERFSLDTPKTALRSEWELPPDKYIILCAASVDEPYKRIQFLIDAVAGLQDDNVFLLLAGQNQHTQYAQETLAMAEAKLGGRYRHINIPYAQMAEIYNASDLFILPSLQESFGKVLLEAMASRLPLLCHDYPNNQWIVKSSESLLDMENTALLQDRIRYLQRDVNAAQALSAENHQWVLERFHWANLREEYLRMYERILLLPA